MTRPKDQSRLGVVLALVGTGLLLQGGADALARSGHKSLALPIFLCALSLLFAACAWRLTSADAARRERVLVSLTLGLGLLASYVMHQPLQLDNFDELIHVGTLVQLLDSHSLFPTNSILPVSPYYPGLELATAATRWLTGLPLVLDQLIVLAAVRVVLVLVVFLVVERACHSSCAGGVAVLVYAASPQFYGFDAQYAYETIALAFAAAVVYLLFVSIDADRPKMGRSFALALCCVVALVFSHHVTTWFTVGFLVVWAAGLYLTSHPSSRLRPALGIAAAPLTGVSETLLVSEGPLNVPSSRASGDERIGEKRRTQAGIVGIAAAVGLVLGGAWTVYVSRLLASYLGPAFSAAAAEISQALGSGHGNRALFQNAAGGGSPPWVIALILTAAIGWCVLLVPSLYSVIFRRRVRGGALRYLPAAIAATFPISLLADVSSTSKAVADRASTFIFFGVALVVGAWLATWISRDRQTIERVATIGVATVIFLGSLIFGFGPVVSLLPGPYVVGGDSLSYGSPSYAVAHFADTHLPAGSYVAADHDNGALLLALGGVTPARKVNPEAIFFDRSFSLYDVYLVRRDDIRYIVVDDRLARGRPLYGDYIAAGEPAKRLTLAELYKFDSHSPFIKRIYDNGQIQVYDVTAMLNPSARAAPAGAPVGGSGFNVGLFLLAALVAVQWLLRLRRRSGPVHDVEHLVVCGVVSALVIGVFGAFLVRLTHAPPDLVAIVVLLFLLALGLRGMPTHPWYLAPFRRGSTDESLGPVPSRSSTGDQGDLQAEWTTGGAFAADRHTSTNASPSLTASMPSSGLQSKVLAEDDFYDRREIKDILAYIRVLVDPGDEVSARRIINVPKRGIGDRSVARMADWARVNHASFRHAIHRAEEAGLTGKALLGAQRLSETLVELRPFLQTVDPAELVQLVADRTGYMAELVAEHTNEADGRLHNLAELSTRAGAFDDVTSFLAAVAPVAGSREPVPTATMSARTDAGRPDTLSAGPTARKSPHPRSQVLLGCLGVVLFALGATVASVSSLGELTPPPELSIATSPIGHSVASVQLGSAGPIPAQLEIRNGGRTLWRSSLARTTKAQSVDLPSRLLSHGSRVVLVSGGHTLRRVDG